MCYLKRFASLTLHVYVILCVFDVLKVKATQIEDISPPALSNLSKNEQNLYVKGDAINSRSKRSNKSNAFGLTVVESNGKEDVVQSDIATIPVEVNSGTQINESSEANATEIDNDTLEGMKNQYVDATTFVNGMNLWDFEGSWAKFNLALLEEPTRPVPDYPTSLDHVVLFTELYYSPTLIRKPFPALEKSTVTITQYFNFTEDFSIIGTATTDQERLLLFNVTEKDLKDKNRIWSIVKYDINVTSPFILKIEASSSIPSMWAIDTITVRGTRINQPANSTMTTQEESTEEKPTTVTTSGVPEISTNSTPTFKPTLITNDTTTEVNNNQTEEADSSQFTEDKPDLDVTKIEEVAMAMWNAFYVFLALLCACFIALLVMIVKQKCSDDPIPPATDSYSPRASSYQLGKSQDNLAYQTESV